MTQTIYFILSMILTTSALNGKFEKPNSIPEQSIRAAFDLGSGTFKLSVAEVNGNHIDLKFCKTIKVSLGQDLAESQNGLFSEKIQLVAFNALTELIKDAQAHGTTEFAGIGTAAFRHAKNGNDFLDKLVQTTNIPIYLISQEQEGILAFKTYLSVFPEMNETNCIALDLGAASLQLTIKTNELYDVLQVPIGVSGVVKIFSENIKLIPYQRGVVFTPITLNEIELLVEEIKNKIPSHSKMQTKLLNGTFEVLYLDDWVDEIEQRTGQKEKISKDQIWNALIKTTDAINRNPNLVEQSCIMAYALLYAIMDKLEINSLRMKLHNSGNTLGMMTEEYFWPESKHKKWEGSGR